MKKVTLTGTLLVVSLFGGLAVADVNLQNKQEIEGSWKLDMTKNSLNDRHPAKREDTWVFKDGSYTILHIPRAGTYYDQLPAPYEIEDGKIKTLITGSSKFDLYSVTAKSDKNMTLKNKYGTYYSFTKE